MSKNQKIAAIAVVLAAIVIVALWMGRDIFLRTPREITCDDGRRRIIDIRDFTTTYWAYSVEFEARIKDQAKVSGKLEPRQLQQLTEALQQANEFRKFIVAGYNACAVSKAQYLQYGAKFNALDAVSRQIDSLVKLPTMTDADRTRLNDLVRRYIELSGELGK
jgi:hypothetical protein